MKRTCCWLKSNPLVFPTVYCGKPAPYKIVRDDDDNKVRKYGHFCVEHQQMVDRQDREEEEQ